MVGRVTAEWGRIDILVNNAGILRDRSFAKMEIEDFRLVVDVHLMGAAICTKAVWEIMREQRHGRIVMTTSSRRRATMARRAMCSPMAVPTRRSEEHTSELQSLMRISYAVFCLKTKNKYN